MIDGWTSNAGIIGGFDVCMYACRCDDDDDDGASRYLRWLCVEVSIPST